MKGVQLFLLGYKCTVLMWLCLRCAETNSESYLMACCAPRWILMRASFVTVRSDTWTERNAHLDTTHTLLNSEQWADEPPVELFVKESRFSAPGTERNGGRPLSRWPGLLCFPIHFLHRNLNVIQQARPEMNQNITTVDSKKKKKHLKKSKRKSKSAYKWVNY